MIRRFLPFIGALAALPGAILTRPVYADAEVVVAMRYLLPKGVSRSHLYLYRIDGKLLRQLSNGDTTQETRPIFAPDGENIVFTRERANRKEYWSITPLGKNLRQLKAAPAWYTAPKASPFFTNFEEPGQQPPAPATGDITARYATPDKAYEVIFRSVKSDPDNDINGPGHGRFHSLLETRSGQETAFGKMPGFEGAADLLHIKGEPTQQFLIEPSLHIAFFGLHIDSSTGDTVYALDMDKRRFTRLSENWAAPFPLPGEAAFLTLTENRYVPIAGSKMTANCTYVEYWNARLEKVRYARAGAGRCYGASMYRPGKVPAIITIPVLDK